jgi:hypothetical protein
LASTLAILTEGFHGFPQSVLANVRIVLRLGHSHFLPHSCRFTIHLPSCYATTYSYAAEIAQKRKHGTENAIRVALQSHDLSWDMMREPMEFIEIECKGVDWIDLAHEWDRWRALVNTVMNLRVP